MRAGDLADELGRERLPFKTDVRKLKNLGLTISLDVGYRLSPRGEAYLRGGAARPRGRGPERGGGRQPGLADQPARDRCRRPLRGVGRHPGQLEEHVHLLLARAARPRAGPAKAAIHSVRGAGIVGHGGDRTLAPWRRIRVSCGCRPPS